MANELLPDHLEAKLAAHRRALQLIAATVLTDEQRADLLRITAFSFEQAENHAPLNEREQLFVAVAVKELESVFGKLPPDARRS